MNILTQKNNVNYEELFSSSLQQTLEKLISPQIQNHSLYNYVELVEELDKTSRELAITTMKATLEKMDYEYRHSPNRKLHYYVKQYRQRTLITVFGDLTYNRTEYIDKYTNKTYCYVDSKLGLRKKERYDPCVQALIIEGYSDNNSMIKVGKLVGDRISGNFNQRPYRNTAIPRQTVFSILHRFNSIKIPLVAKEETPETLYVMVDEKNIALQNEESKTKAMTKAAVIFERIEAILKKDGTATKRNKVVNKTNVLSAEGSIWERINDVLYQIYDMDKVKTLFLMGDGAKWIENGSTELALSNGEVIFALDRFHFKQAINRLTSDQSIRQLLYEYGYCDMKEEFQIVANSLKVTDTERVSVIKENLSYLLKQWNAYQTMNKVVMIGCPMEQVISHVLASQFTSVPKAYSRKHLPCYFNYRELHQNSYDLRNVIVKAMALQTSKNKDIVIPLQEYDFSIFEKKSHCDSPTIREFNKNIITQF